MSPSSDASSKKLVVQQLRGWAIIFVLLTHFSILTYVLQKFPVRITNSGYLGVELFFIISGYVVTNSLVRNNWDIRHFVIRRIFRLYPALLLFVAFSLSVWAVTISYGPDELPYRLFGSNFSRYTTEAAAILTGVLVLFVSPTIYSNGAMWSLSVEFQFYVFVGLMMGVLSISKANFRSYKKWMLACSIIVIVLCIFGRIYHLFGYRISLAFYLFSWRFDFLAAGVLIALAPEAALRRLATSRPRVVLAAAITLSLLALAAFRSPLVPPTREDWLEAIGFPFALLLLTLAVAVAVTLSDRGVGDTWFGRALLWFGDRSYSIYLLHFPIMALLWFGFWLTDLRLVAEPWTYAIAQLVVGVLLVSLAADFCFRYLERPSIQFGRRFLRMKEKARPRRTQCDAADSHVAHPSGRSAYSTYQAFVRSARRHSE